MGVQFGYTSPLLFVSESQIALWFKPDVGITLSGSYVTAWQDQSPNGRVAIPTDPAYAPLYIPSFFGSYPSIKFDGIDDRLEFTPVYNASTIDSTVFIVGNLNGDGGSQGFIGTTAFRLISYQDGNPSFIQAGNGGSLNVDLTTRINLNNIFVGAFNLQNRTSSFYLNGVNVSATNGYQDTIGSPFRLGAGSTSTGYQSPLNGYISEVLMISGSISPQTISDISNTLVSKYCVQT